MEKGFNCSDIWFCILLTSFPAKTVSPREMTLAHLFQALGEEVQDPEEGVCWTMKIGWLKELIEVSESFLLFSQSVPSQNLGFIDPKANSLDILVAGKDLIIHQSPAILSSNRKGGTTGAGGFPFSLNTMSIFWDNVQQSSGRSPLYLRTGLHQRIMFYSEPLP